MTTFKIAAFQKHISHDNLEHTIGQVRAALAWADAHRVSLACFPECYLQGYFLERDAAARVGLRLDSDAFRLILERVAPFKAPFVLGMIEEDNGALFNTAVVVSKGKLIGRYRKTHPNERCFSPGDEYPVFDLYGLKFGINICNDANFPEAAARVATAGAKVIVFPLNNLLPRETAERWRSRSTQNLRDRARETGCWVVSADMVGEGDGRIGYGCTQIVTPTGAVVCAVAGGADAVAVATINL